MSNSGREVSRRVSADGSVQMSEPCLREPGTKDQDLCALSEPLLRFPKKLRLVSLGSSPGRTTTLTSDVITRRTASQRIVSSSTTNSSTPSSAPKRKKAKSSNSLVVDLVPRVAEPASAPRDAERVKSRSPARAKKPGLPLDVATEAGVTTSADTLNYGNKGEERQSHGGNLYQDPGHEDGDNSADSDDCDVSDDWSDSNKSNAHGKNQPANTSIYSPSHSRPAQGTITSDISSDVEEDLFWALHEDHRVLKMLCESAAPVLHTPRNIPRTADIQKMPNSDRKSERFCRLRYKFDCDGCLEEEEIQEVTEMVKQMLVWGQGVQPVGQGMADRGDERLKSSDQTNFAMLHKRFSIDSE
ncbi:hypothetical protein FRC00_005345 [Tulasnella sp. 408]|nr:hypothetical protein FRC00_005345 [Tulasnella sp. 408]